MRGKIPSYWRHRRDGDVVVVRDNFVCFFENRNVSHYEFVPVGVEEDFEPFIWPVSRFEGQYREISALEALASV